jgi:hypothetical protein
MRGDYSFFEGVIFFRLSLVVVGVDVLRKSMRERFEVVSRATIGIHGIVNEKMA